MRVTSHQPYDVTRAVLGEAVGYVWADSKPGLNGCPATIVFLFSFITIPFTQNDTMVLYVRKIVPDDGKSSSVLLVEPVRVSPPHPPPPTPVAPARPPTAPTARVRALLVLSLLSEVSDSLYDVNRVLDEAHGEKVDAVQDLADLHRPSHL